MNLPRRHVLWLGFTAALAGCAKSSPRMPESSNLLSSGSPGKSESATANASQTSTSQLDHHSPASISVLVNKAHPLQPQNWAPEDLTSVGTVQVRAEVAQATQKMLVAAAEAGVNITTLSGFRSYETQVETYNNWVSTYGQEHADTASARPGYSEHQTGLALDFGAGSACDLQVCFADSPEAQWLAKNAHRFGFILRFPYGEHETTGYWFESWHYRYIGESEAQRYQNADAASLEEWWGFEPAPQYLS